MTISDQTGKVWVTAFNDVAEPLLNGKTADELHELKESGEVSLSVIATFGAVIDGVLQTQRCLS